MKKIDGATKEISEVTKEINKKAKQIDEKIRNVIVGRSSRTGLGAIEIRLSPGSCRPRAPRKTRSCA